jgi:hypothetical protein
MLKVFSNKNVIISSVMFVFFIVWSLAVSFMGFRDTPISYYYNASISIVYFWGAFVAFRAIPKVQITSTIGKVLTATGSALVLFGLGDLVWGYYVLFLKISAPYPSMADVLYTLYIPALILTFVFLLIAFKATLTVRNVMETLVFSVATFAVIFFVLIQPEIPAGSINLKTFFDIIYPLGDVLILSTAFLALRLAGSKIRSMLHVFIIATIIEVAADIIFSKTTGAGTYYNGSLADVLFLTNAWMLTIGVVSIIQNFSLNSTPTPSSSQI